MTELAIGLWPYIERAGAVAALLMIFAVIWLVKRLGEEQERCRAKEVEHLTDVKMIVPVLERNNAALQTQAETIKALLAERRA